MESKGGSSWFCYTAESRFLPNTIDLLSKFGSFYFGEMLFTLTLSGFIHYHWYKKLCEESKNGVTIHSKYAKLSEQGEETYYTEELLQETSYHSMTLAEQLLLTNSTKSRNTFKKNQSLAIFEKAKSLLSRHPFIPAFYCLYDIQGHLQTIIQYFVRNFTRLLYQTRLFQLTSYYIRYEREIIKLPDDGTVAIDWVITASDLDSERNLAIENCDKPILILHHGLNGDSQAEYIYHLICKIQRSSPNKYAKIGVLIARGCGGLPLTSFTTFSGRRSYDLFYVIRYLKQIYPDNALFWIGFSLGAAITLHYLEDFPQLIEEEEEALQVAREREEEEVDHPRLMSIVDPSSSSSPSKELKHQLTGTILHRSPSSQRIILNDFEQLPLTSENLLRHNKEEEEKILHTTATAEEEEEQVAGATLPLSSFPSAISLIQLQRKETLLKRQQAENNGITAALCICPPWNLDRQALGLNLWSILMLIPLKLYLFQHLPEFLQFNPFITRDGHSQVVESTPLTPAPHQNPLLTVLQLFLLKDINELDRYCYRFYGENYSLLQLQQTTNDSLEFLSSCSSSLSSPSSVSTDSPSEASSSSSLDLFHAHVLGKKNKRHNHHPPHHHHVHIRYKRKADKSSTKTIFVYPTSEEEERSSTDSSGRKSSSLEGNPSPVRKHPSLYPPLEYHYQQHHQQQFNPKSAAGVVRYQSLEEYYVDTSPKYKAYQITTPTLAISSRDDPICAAQECPEGPAEIGSGLVIVQTKYGGHLAFPTTGWNNWTESWIDSLVDDWFEQFL